MANQLSQFEDILLPPVILAGLYSQSLVVIDKVSKETKNNGDAGTFKILAKENLEISNSESISDKILKEDTVNLGLYSLGNFEKNILVLVNDKTSLHLADPELELLGKMLQALKLSFADIAILNIATQECHWEMIYKQLPTKRVVLFGVEPTDIKIPVRFPHFRVQRWSEISFLYSPALAEINSPSENQVIYKKELWKALQEMFS